MKLTKQKLYQLILEELSGEDLKKLAQIRPNYLLDLPVQKYSDEPVEDEYGDLVYKTDEWGRETDLEFEKIPMKNEIIRSRIADMKAGGLDPEHIKKLAKLMQDDPFDKQVEELARALAPDDNFRFSTFDAGPKVSDSINRKLNLDRAYREIRDSRELSTYKMELSNRMMHDGSMDYRDNFYEADENLSNFEKRIAKKYDLTEEEIDKLDDMLEIDKESY